jgi:hypothetical protein
VQECGVLETCCGWVDERPGRPVNGVGNSWNYLIVIQYNVWPAILGTYHAVCAPAVQLATPVRLGPVERAATANQETPITNSTLCLDIDTSVRNAIVAIIPTVSRGCNKCG